MDDHDSITLIQKRLENAVREIRNMTSSVGSAKQVKAYDSDRRKALLARFMLPYLKGGNSAAAADVDARSEPGYKTELDLLATQLEDAEKTISRWEGAFATYEAARSLLSMAKESIRTMEG